MQTWSPDSDRHTVSFCMTVWVACPLNVLITYSQKIKYILAVRDRFFFSAAKVSVSVRDDKPFIIQRRGLFDYLCTITCSHPPTPPTPTHNETGEEGGESTQRRFYTHALNIWSALRKKPNGILCNLIRVARMQALGGWLCAMCLTSAAYRMASSTQEILHHQTIQPWLGLIASYHPHSTLIIVDTFPPFKSEM